MVVRNVVRSPVRAVVQSVFGEGESFHPFQLFRSGAQGAWYDPSDFSTLYQDAAGTTPVTAVEQPVRLMRDRSGRGNDATAPNDASRPILRARYNLLTYTEQFDNAAWSKVNATVTANAGVAPDGTTTADAIVANGSGSPDVRQTVGTTAGVTYTQTQFVKYTNNTWVCLRYLAGSEEGRAWFNIQDGSVGARSGIATSSTVTALGGGWFRIAAVFAVTITAASPTFRLHLATANNDGLATVSAAQSCNLWGASLLTAADQAATGGAYQRVGAATDYDTGPPWRPYLAFDGSDDSMSTSSIDFSGTDEMTVFAGVSKLSDAALGIVAEFSADSDTTAGTFAFAAPASPTTNRVLFTAGGTTRRAVTTTAAAYNAPVTLVLTGLGDISGDATTLRANGVQVAQNTGDQGTGNFANAALFIGRRNNTSFPLNGRLYSLAVLGRTATAPELTAMESWIAGKTGVSL